MHQLLNRVRRPKIISSDVNLLNHCFSGYFLVLGIVRLPFKCRPLWFFDSLAFYKFSRPYVKMEGKSSTQIWNWTFFFYVLPIDNGQLDAIVRFRVWMFSSVECDWFITISRNVQNLGFWKTYVFFLKTCMITVTVEAFII